MIAALPFGPGGLAFITLYLLSLLALGWWGRRARTADTLKDFYLAGPGVGFAVLLLTLYATQWSGNTLFGYTGKAYREGFSWLVSLHFMTGLVVCYLLFAPWLQRLAKRHGFITPADYLMHRFDSRPLCLLAVVVMIIGVANYLLAQLIAMGTAVEVMLTFDIAAGAIPDDPATSRLAYGAFVGGVILLVVIMLIYENLGGFRAVAWTDAIQGVILIIGFLLMLGLVVHKYGTPAQATTQLIQDARQAEAAAIQNPTDATEKARAQATRKIDPPATTAGKLNWLSWILIVGLGGAMYPQAIQRIYAARNGRTLRRSLAVMVFLPLTATLTALFVGIIASTQDLSIKNSEHLLPAVCRVVMDTPVGYWLVVLLTAAILAALMSTADSVLLIISAMVTKDLYARHLNPTATESQLTRLGKWVSAAVVLLMAAIAIAFYDHRDPRENILIVLLKLKFEMLVQLAPAFILGIHCKNLRAGPVLAGMATGLAVALALFLQRKFAATPIDIHGLHEGVIGLAANLIVIAGATFLCSRDRRL